MKREQQRAVTAAPANAGELVQEAYADAPPEVRAAVQFNALPRWRWTAAKQHRTCAACLAMDGREFPASEPLDGHPNCRCVMVPVTPSWEELGFEGIPDTRRKREAGEE